MNGSIRQHFLTQGDALDFRRVEELFLEAARRFNGIGGHAIGNKQFRRDAWNLFTWEEYLSKEARDLEFTIPEHGLIVSNCLLEVVHDDGFLEAELSWSLDVQPNGGADPKAIFAWPVLGGQALYQGEDMAMCSQLVQHVTPVAGVPAVDPTDSSNEDAPQVIDDTLKITLGNSCAVALQNGRSHAGLALLSIGRFTVQKSTLAVRKVLR